MSVGRSVPDMSIVTLVDSFLSDAVLYNASDIHLEPTASGLRVRMRVDGLLSDYKIMPEDDVVQILARVKVLARLDVAEKRIPQDGKFSIVGEKGSVDLRVSTFPGLYGEKIVIRLLERSDRQFMLESLGFDPDVLKDFLSLIRRATGFFLVTGPTGSGKTTTLYAALSLLKSPEKNVVTLEDPIEYHIDGITQGQIIPDIGFTFDRGIRSLLRQDPDIIMVGEIRDRETAETAVQAALTGHLVLSTLHTHDAPGAVMRLLDMGIPAFLINATLTGMLAQRLVRILCTSCRIESVPTPDERDFLRKLGITLRRAYKAVGCPACHGRGYCGRTGIFELLTMTPELRSLIGSNPSCAGLTERAVADGMIQLRFDAARKIESGVTTIEELARVVW